MPSQRAQAAPEPGQPCSYCEQIHLTHRGGPACEGHVTTDRDSYVPGQPRKKLDRPRPCRRAPVIGGRRCTSHGVNQQTREAAERRVTEQKARALAATLGAPIEDGRDPADVIADRIAVRRGQVRWLYERVQKLDPEALAWGLTKRKTAVARDSGDDARAFAGTDEGDTHEAKPSIWYVLYEEASSKLERLCIEAVRVGIEQRRLQIDERMADTWVRVIDGIVTSLGHDPNDPETAELVAHHLELVA